MNSTKTETKTSHLKSLLSHLHACEEHIKALHPSPVSNPEDFEKEYERALIALMDNCGCSPCEPEKETDTPSFQPTTATVDDVECVIIPCSDFEQLFHDMVTMHDMLDYMIGLLEKKQHLARTMLGVANKLDTSASERTNISDVMERMENIAERWANMDITPAKEQ